MSETLVKTLESNLEAARAFETLPLGLLVVSQAVLTELGSSEDYDAIQLIRYKPTVVVRKTNDELFDLYQQQGFPQVSCKMELVGVTSYLDSTRRSLQILYASCEEFLHAVDEGRTIALEAAVEELDFPTPLSEDAERVMKFLEDDNAKAVRKHLRAEDLQKLLRQRHPDVIAAIRTQFFGESV